MKEVLGDRRGAHRPARQLHRGRRRRWPSSTRMAPPFVVKTDGLAAGKGVLVTDVADRGAQRASSDYLSGAGLRRCRPHRGDRGGPGRPRAVGARRVRRHTGPCCCPRRRTSSASATATPGPNTGGMGAYSPVPVVGRRRARRRSWTDFVEPTLAALRAAGIDYRGVLYAGLMLTAEGPKMLEYNVRFGDPETQVVLPRLHLRPGRAARPGGGGPHRRPSRPFAPTTPSPSCARPEGYPASPRTGDAIAGIDDAARDRGRHGASAPGSAAGDDGGLVTAGGRVLNVCGRGPTLAEARGRAYEGVAADRLARHAPPHRHRRERGVVSRTAGPVVGIVGGGQLARMLAEAATPMGIHVRVLAAPGDEGATEVVPDVQVGAPDDADALRSFAATVDVVTFDHENVDHATLAALEAEGVAVRPGRRHAAALRQGAPAPGVRRRRAAGAALRGGRSRFHADGRGRSRAALRRAPRPTPRAGSWPRRAEVATTAAVCGCCARTTSSRSWPSTAAPRSCSSRSCRSSCEVAVLVARRPSGETVTWPVLETVQVDGMCDEVFLPSSLPEDLDPAAREIAEAIADMTGVGRRARGRAVPGRRATAGERDRAPGAQLRPPDHRGHGHVAVRTTPASHPRLAAGPDRPHGTRRGHGQRRRRPRRRPARPPGVQRSAPCPVPTCTCTASSPGPPARSATSRCSATT